MDSEPIKASPSLSSKASDIQTPGISGQEHRSTQDAPSIFSASGISSWARNLKIPQNGDVVRSNFERFTSGFGSRLSTKTSKPDESAAETSNITENGVLGSLKKGFVDSSRSAVKAVQVKARHIVSQNKRRYQEGEFDLDLTYITDNIIAMGFPAGDISSGLFGYLEGFYRNHMEEVIKFLETNHKGKYKVYNLCSERLYDASLFQGKVAAFPFEDNSCPQIQLILLFCESAYSWLKEDMENVVVVHCKSGIARTGLMISSLLLFLKFLSTAKESIDYYNQKRCLDGKGLVLPSQIRYVKYFERILADYNRQTPPGRRCMLRGFRLHKCPFWIRPSITVSNQKGILFSTHDHPKTKNLMPEDFWMGSRKKGIMVFVLPGERGLTELTGDFKIYFHERQGDFSCWLNTTMMENREILNPSDLDGFDKRSLPSPGFQVEIVVVHYDGTNLEKTKNETTSTEGSGTAASGGEVAARTKQAKGVEDKDKDDVFSSDSESEENQSTRTKKTEAATSSVNPESGIQQKEVADITHGLAHIAVKSGVIDAPTTKSDGVESVNVESVVGSDIKAIAADASVFSFGDDEEGEDSDSE